jgi:hypothetical protein
LAVFEIGLRKIWPFLKYAEARFVRLSRIDYDIYGHATLPSELNDPEHRLLLCGCAGVRYNYPKRARLDRVLRYLGVRIIRTRKFCKII